MWSGTGADDQSCNGGTSLCRTSQSCIAANKSSGRRFGCSPVLKAEVCSDSRFSCPAGSKCDIMKEQCYQEDSLSHAPLLENVDAVLVKRDNVSNNVCGVISGDLPARCQCTDELGGGGSVDCLLGLLDHDRIGVQLNILPCSVPARVDITVDDSDHGVHFEVAGVKAGQQKDIPIPGLTVGIPGLANAGVFLAVEVDGNAEALYLKIGLNACLQVAFFPVCGSRLSRQLPLWILKGTYNFSNACQSDAMQILVM